MKKSIIQMNWFRKVLGHITPGTVLAIIMTLTTTITVYAEQSDQACRDAETKQQTAVNAKQCDMYFNIQTATPFCKKLQFDRIEKCALNSKR